MSGRKSVSAFAEESRPSTANSEMKSDTGQDKPKKQVYRFIGAEDEKVQNKDIKPSTIWTGFKDRTTAHGIPHIDKAKGSCKIVLWVIVTLGCVGALLYQITLSSQYFFGNPIDVIVSLEHERELTFPSVTICNINPLKKSSLQDNTPLHDLLIESSSRRKRDLKSRTRRSTSGHNIQAQAMEIYTTMAEDELSSLSYTVNESVVDCRFAGSGCYHSEFTSYFDPVFGNCFLFNSGWTGLNLEMSKRPGRRHGLHVVMNVKQDEYIGELADGAGVRVVVHPQERMPFPSDEGILANPGELTSIGIRQTSIARLGYQFGNCTYVSGSNKKRNVFEELYNVQYSSTACYRTCSHKQVIMCHRDSFTTRDVQLRHNNEILACYRTCYQKHVIKQCDCADPEIPTTGKAFGNHNVNACREANDDETSCKDRILEEFQNDELNCKCPIPCEEIAYSFEVSGVEWPSIANEQTIIDNFEDSIPELSTVNDTSSFLRSNLLKIEVYFQEFNFETITERPAYKNESYVSDIGGILGLWVGCSVISLFEFFELFADFLVLGCYACINSEAVKRCTSRLKGDRRRVGSALPHTPPPPYTSTVNLRERMVYKRPSTRNLPVENVPKTSIRLV